MFRSALALTLVVILSTLANTLPLVEPVEEVMVQKQASKVEVIGGKGIDIIQAPYQVSIQLKGKHHCGGCLIADDLVMTAYHCFWNTEVFTIKIRVGSTYSDKGGQLVDVEDMIGHKDYDHKWAVNDIMIIRLSEKVELSDSVKVLPLASMEKAAGTKAFASGWGQTSETNSVLPLHLQGAEVDLISREQCRHEYSVDDIADNNICTSTEGKDTCKGDSGGPLEVNGELIGIISWGTGCNRKPGVLTSVPAMSDWIEKTKTEIYQDYE